MKSRSMRWPVDVPRGGEERNTHGVERKRPLGGKGIDGKIIVQWIFKKLGLENVDRICLATMTSD